METIKNIQKVSFFFFLVIGFVHLISGFIVANEYYGSPFNIINKTLDLPFIISGILYGISSIKTSIADSVSKSKSVDIILISLGIIVLGFSIYINLFIPDK